MFVLGTSILEEEMSFEEIGVKGALMEAGREIRMPKWRDVAQGISRWC